MLPETPALQLAVADQAQEEQAVTTAVVRVLQDKYKLPTL